MDEDELEYGMPRLTIAEYEQYQEAPQWERDGYSSEDAYHEDWASKIHTWQKAYDSHFKETKDRWKSAIEYIETAPKRTFDTYAPDSTLADSRIPFAFFSIMEKNALLYSNYPIPIFISPGKDTDIYAMALNQCTQIELKANNFSALMFDVGLDVGIANLGVLKVWVDPDQKGPYGQDGKIVIEKIDPSKMAFDPKAKRLRWENLGYVIATEEYDLGTARRIFKGSGHRLTEAMAMRQDSDDKDKGSMYGSFLTSPVPNPMEGNASNRNRVLIRECWFKDERLKFEAFEETVDNSEFILSDDGFREPNPDYDPEREEIYTRPKTDEAGFVIGHMVQAYPNGRCIITANDSVVVRDFENPFWHKRAPFIFFKTRPSKGLVTTGDLTNLIVIDQKLNDILSRIHTMAQNEIERPMIAETNTFRTPRAWMKMTGQATAVLVKNAGKEFGRMPFMEIPSFVWLYLQQLYAALDKVMAVAGVMRGQLTEGSQLSAEAVGDLQGMASSILKMQADLVSEGMKELGYQMSWLERQTYKFNIPLTITLPDGEKEQLEWNEKDAAADYIVDIQPGSGMPGSNQMQVSQVLPLYREGLIDQMAALTAIKWPDKDEIVPRMQKNKLAKIESAAAGKAMGTVIKQFEKTDGSAGRKEKP
jgi:hypothetical protein